MTNPTTEVAIRLYELYSNGDIDRVLELLDDGYQSHGFGGGGREQLRMSLQGFRNAFPDVVFTVEDTITEGDKVAVKTTFRATHQGPFAGVSPTGRTVDIAGVDLLTEQDGRFIEAWSLRELNGLWVQLGVVPTHHTIHPTHERSIP